LRRRDVRRAAVMGSARKVRKSAPIAQAVAVNTREVNVAVEGIDASAIAGSFAVHLMKDGRRIASRFLFQPPPDSAGTAQADRPDRFAHFDFVLPIDAVADGKLTVEIEPSAGSRPGEVLRPDLIGQPTLSVYLMLETE
jgi:hypothetical protein